VATDSLPAEDTASPTFIDGALATIRLKGLKYSMVSVFNVIFGATLLYLIVHFTNRPTYGNIAAVCISAVPSYYLSRRWVWGKRGKSELRREVIPFWIFVGIGLVISTASVYVATHFFPTPAEAPFFSLRKLLPNVANLSAFGVLWVIRFFWMDKAFHLDHHHAHGPLDVLLDEDEPV
jgi:putative flippase GtrA